MCSLVVVPVAAIGCELHILHQISMLTLYSYNLLTKLNEVGYLEDGRPQDAWTRLSWQYSREVQATPVEIKQGTWLSQEEWEEEWE